VFCAPLGCAPHVDAQYAHAASRADALYVSGRYLESADAWLSASCTALTQSDQDEAVYRAATSFAKAGDTKRAEALFARLAQGNGSRAARASFDRARLVGESDPERGEALRLEALRRHPESGVAPQALRDYLAGIEQREGEAAALARCEALSTELATTELDEATSYECARRHEQRGDDAAALRGYLATAERHPYPHGALWDDALAGAARIKERLGDPRAAVALLERLLAQREHSAFFGSYERQRYVEARFHIAELYRDALGDPGRATQEFRRVFDEHPTSLLADDALFEEARLEARAGEASRACKTLEILRKHAPESRFVGCSSLLCASAPPANRACPDELSAKLTAAPPR
jgi:TolA-binding protein